MQSDEKKGLMSAAIFGLGIALIAFMSGMYVGSSSNIAATYPLASLTGFAAQQPEGLDLAPLWKTWYVLNERFVAASTTARVDDQEKVWGMVQGLAASYGDPYTTFFPPEENKKFEEEISGNFEGVGMEIDIKDGVLTVVAPLKESPAEKAGVHAGDQVLAIDGKPSDGLTVEAAIKRIRGPKGTTVKLSILRGGESLEIDVVRDVIQIPTIKTKGVAKGGGVVEEAGELRDDGIFVIQLYNFAANSVFDFRQALRTFIDSGSNKLILDLRGNPGGYLEAAVDMASWFLPAGTVIVSEDFGTKKEEHSYRSKGYNVFAKDLKMVILINRGSASASEILAGALQEHGVATLIGERSYGKGSVQELIPITSDTSLKVTIARWLTPKGNTISETGITPDIEVKITKEDLEKQRDPQFDKAVEILNG
jgi:carboxyl-terminal processing protease